MASKYLTNQSLTSNSSSSTSITRILQSIKPNSATNTFQNSSKFSQFSPHLNPNLVIQVINNQTNPHHALIFFNWASIPSPNPTNYTHNFSCYNAISHRLFSTATQFIESHNKLSDLTIAEMIKAYGDENNIKGAIDCFCRAKRAELDGNCILSLNTLLGVLVENKRMKLASEIFDQVVDEGLIELNVVTYTTMIDGYCKAGKIEDAHKLFDKMPCIPNKVTYDAMLQGFCSKGMMVAAHEMFNNMLMKEDCLPDSITYSTLIEGYCKNGEMDVAMECYDEMVKKGFQPNLHTCNTIVNGLCLIGKVDEAKNVIPKMRLDGVKDNINTHSRLLNRLCYDRRLDEAVEHLKDMGSVGINPNGKVFAMLLRKFCEFGKANEASALVRDMVARGINPSVRSVNLVLRALVDIKELDEAFRLLKWMLEIGGAPNSLSYHIVIESISRTSDRVQQVEELIDYMLRSGRALSPSIYSCLTMVYTLCGKLETASRVFYDALRNGCVINLESFTVLVEGLYSKGNVSDAEQHALELYNKSTGTQWNEYRWIFNSLKRKYSDEKS